MCCMFANQIPRGSLQRRWRTDSWIRQKKNSAQPHGCQFFHLCRRNKKGENLSWNESDKSELSIVRLHFDCSCFWWKYLSGAYSMDPAHLCLSHFHEDPPPPPNNSPSWLAPPSAQTSTKNYSLPQLISRGLNACTTGIMVSRSLT